VTGDRIAIRGLRVRGNHGVFDHERQEGQEFVVDAVLEVDTSAAAASDDVGLTVDYGVVAFDIVSVVAGPPVNLIETLAALVAAKCLRHRGVAAVEVTVHKPHAPILLLVDPSPVAPENTAKYAKADFDDVSVTIVRRRDDASGR
jgi:dihydroneopterin aldolase